jgi:hypothetical protein
MLSAFPLSLKGDSYDEKVRKPAFPQGYNLPVQKQCLVFFWLDSVMA